LQEERQKLPDEQRWGMQLRQELQLLARCSEILSDDLRVKLGQLAKLPRLKEPKRFLIR